MHDDIVDLRSHIVRNRCFILTTGSYLFGAGFKDSYIGLGILGGKTSNAVAKKIDNIVIGRKYLRTGSPIYRSNTCACTTNVRRMRR